MNKKSNPCTDNLTDEEYLIHMIPHHQVAIDMSKELQKKTKKPNMIYLSREIIRKQGYEIWEMEMIKKNIQTNYIPLHSNNNIYQSLPVDHIYKVNARKLLIIKKIIKNESLVCSYCARLFVDFNQKI